MVVAVVMAVVVVVAVVVSMVVAEAPVVHVSHVARMMGMVKVSQATPAREEPGPAPPDSASPCSRGREVPLHILVLRFVVQAGDQKPQQQHQGRQGACNQAGEGRAPQEAQHLGAGGAQLSEAPCCFLSHRGPCTAFSPHRHWTLLSQLPLAGEQPGNVGAACLD